MGVKAREKRKTYGFSKSLIVRAQSMHVLRGRLWSFGFSSLDTDVCPVATFTEAGGVRC